MISSKNNQDFSILSPISSNNKYPNYKPYEGDNLNEQDNFLFKVKSVDGYAMLFNKKRINEVLKKEPEIKNQKYFDENFFMYLENDDLCKRILDKQDNIYIVPESKINHLGGRAVNSKYKEEIEYSRNWHWIWSKFYFNKKHNGYLKALIQGLPTFFSAILNAFL